MELKELIELKAKCNLEKNFNVQWDMEKPLRDWALKVFRTKCAKLGMTIDSQIFRWALDQAAHCTSISEDKMGLLLDNDEYKITAFLDYDMGYTWVKFNVHHKESGLKHRNSLGRKD